MDVTSLIFSLNAVNAFSILNFNSGDLNSQINLFILKTSDCFCMYHYLQKINVSSIYCVLVYGLARFNIVVQSEEESHCNRQLCKNDSNRGEITSIFHSPRERSNREIYCDCETIPSLNCLKMTRGLPV